MITRTSDDRLFKPRFLFCFFMISHKHSCQFHFLLSKMHSGMIDDSGQSNKGVRVRVFTLESSYSGV